MGKQSAIAWCDATWNPWQGCHKVSLGCRECYMFREKMRYGQDPDVVVRSKPHTFNLPLRLKTPQRVFTCSWSDWFIEEADAWRDEAWAIVERTPHLTYQVLTKRIERAWGRLPWGGGTPWPHVQIIVSAENQATADERVQRLLVLNVAVRGVSYEPAIGPIDFTRVQWGHQYRNARREPAYTDALTERTWFYDEGDVDQPRLDWIIVGGESGPKARPFDLAWARDAIAQGKASGIPVFVKQLGAQPVTTCPACAPRGVPRLLGEDRCQVCFETGLAPVILRDRKGGDPEEWPADLRVREFPAGVEAEPRPT